MLLLLPQCFPNVFKRVELNLACVDVAKVLLDDPVIEPRHLDDGGRVAVHGGGGGRAEDVLEADL